MSVTTEAPAAAGDSRRTAPPFGLIVLILFLGSGFAGLVYEVLWTRMLTYIFGATLYAVSTVLATYMGGLALGSFLFGRWVDKRRNPLRVYALLEIGIAASAFAVPYLLRIADPIFTSLYSEGTPSFGLLTLVRFGLAVAVMIVPTTLMGGTLPVLSKWYGRATPRLGMSLGALYAINTFGAVLGCYVAGFHGIAALGVHGMAFVAVGVNVGVGVLALLLSTQKSALVEPAAADAPQASDLPRDELLTDVTPTTARLVFWFYGISGFVALAYEVCWTRSLIFSFDQLKNTTYSFSAMLAVFLVGLALGSAVMTLFADRLPEPVRCFSLLQLGIGLMGAFSFMMIHGFAPGFEPFKALGDDPTRINFPAAVANVFAKTGVSIFLPTFLMGMAYPVAVRCCVPSLSRVGRTVGSLYSINTIGAILGSLGAGFVLIRFMGIPWTMYLLTLVSIGMAIILTLNLQDLHPARRYLVIGLGVLCALILFIRYPFRAVFQRPDPGYRLIQYKEGPLATVSVVQGISGRTLYVDNVGVAGTDRILLTDQKSLAHIPMLFLDAPKTALTVGFGSGGASWSYLQYAALQKLDCIEICKTVVEFWPLLTMSNESLLHPTDPSRIALREGRYRIIYDDVRSYLRFAPVKYDIIATDCTDLRYKTNANLYDVQYFQLCRDRLNEGGMVVVWMPLGGLAPETFEMALRTFREVFPDFAVWYMNNEPTHYILLLGLTEPLQIDYALMRRKLEERSVAEDLNVLELDDADKLLSCYVTDSKALADKLGENHVNTEDHPYLEFETPLYGYSEQPLFDNLDWLVDAGGSLESYLKPGSYTPEDLERIKTYQKAVGEILKGHRDYRELKVADAARDYMKAIEICPEDRATERLLEFDVLQTRATMPGDFYGRLELSRVLTIQGRDEEAILYLRQCLDMGESLRKDTTLPDHIVTQVRDAAEILRDIFQKRENAEELNNLARRMRNMPTQISDGWTTRTTDSSE